MRPVLARDLAWTVLLAFAGACDSADRSASPSEPTPTQLPMHLDIHHPTASLPIGKDAGKAKFVEVSIDHVVNPALAAVSFTVAYRVANEITPLGSFSLYPPDHPGSFIVPTQGKIRLQGSILITLENPDKDARIQATIAKIRLVSEQEPSQ